MNNSPGDIGARTLAAESMSDQDPTPTQREALPPTVENRLFSHALAGPGSRAAACLVDTLISNGVSQMLTVLILLVWRVQWTDGEWNGGQGSYALFAFFFFYIMLWTSYFVFFEWLLDGQTPGKLLLHIRVVKRAGPSLLLMDALVRNLFRVIDFLPCFYAIGLVSILVTKDRQRLGDWAAGTLVVNDDPVRAEPPLDMSDFAWLPPAAASPSAEAAPVAPGISAGTEEQVPVDSHAGAITSAVGTASQVESDPFRESADGRPEIPKQVNPQFPIIRTAPGFFKGDVVAIYETHIIQGTRLLFPLLLTEDMCHAAGEKLLRRSLHWSRRFEITGISEVCEEFGGRRKWWSSRAGEPRASRFTIRAKRRTKLRFWIASSQVKRVRAELGSRFADIYRVREMRLMPGCLARPLQFMTMMPMFGGIFALLSLLLELGIKERSAIEFIVAFAFIVSGLIMTRLPWDLLVPQRRWIPPLEWAAASRRTSVPRRVVPVQRRQPLRSRRLGWMLKVLGLLYGIIVVAPMELASEKRSNGSYNALTQQILVFLWLPCPLLIYNGYRLCQRPYDPSRRSDSRKPILFLRPFADDISTSLQPAGLLSAFTGLRREMNFLQMRTKRVGGRLNVTDLFVNCLPMRLLRMLFDYDVGTSEESICRYFHSLGPVIAIGRPGESMPSPGAARMYVSDDQWQLAISSELERAHAVVVQPGLTRGVRWELEQIHSMVEPNRVLFCLVSYWKEPQAYEELCRNIREILHCELPRVVPYLDRPAFVFFDRDWTPRLQILSYRCQALWPLTADAADLKRSLRPFVQGLDGSEQLEPLPPRWTGGILTGLATSVAIIMTMAINIIQVESTRYIARSVLGPIDSESFIERGRDRLGKGEFDLAIKDFSEAIRLEPKSSIAFNSRGVAFLQKREFDGAVRDFDVALRLDSTFALASQNRAIALTSRGVSLYRQGEFDRAIDEFDEAIRSDSGLALAFYNRGNAHGKKGMFDQAILDYDQAIRLNPMDQNSFINRGVYRAAKGEFNLAIEDYTEAIRLDPNSAVAFNNRGLNWKAKREFEKAIEDYDAALRLDPERAAVLSAKAWLLATCPLERVRDGKKAVDLAAHACDLANWGRPDDLVILAAAYAEAGDFESAVKSQEKAIQDPNYASRKGPLAHHQLQLYKDQKPYREE